MSRPDLVGVVWWPHSGGRWFCRSLLKGHPEVRQVVFAHPWFFVGTDATLELDNTTQVHKARSLPEFGPQLRALVSSTDKGRRTGLTEYLSAAQRGFDGADDGKPRVIGELCMGTPVPRMPDLAAIYDAWPDIKLIHLVRSPIACYSSFAVRHELDGDPIRIAGSWVTAAAYMRSFHARRSELARSYLEVRYEDLVASTRETLERVCEFLGLSFDSAMLGSEHRWGRSTEETILQEVESAILSVAGPELRMHGYAANGRLA